MRDMMMGYTGQRRSGVSGSYPLGNGYRGFNPVLKRFAGQDSMSPFGAGGEHGFAYCGGNPANYTDPSGHLFRWLWALLGIKTSKKVAKKSAEVTVTSMLRTAEADASVTNSLTLTDSAALGESSTDTALSGNSGLQLSGDIGAESSTDYGLFPELDPSVRQPMAEDSVMHYLSRPGGARGSFRITPVKGGAGSRPSGLYQFVIRADEPDKVRVGQLATPYGHTSLAYRTAEQVVGVRYAGDIQFGEGGNIIKWNNQSGHFQPSAHAAGGLVDDFRNLLPTRERKLQYW